jgi:hypothetical protein
MNPNESPKENTTGLLRLFVYGTLKRDCWNHERFCRGVLSVEEAVVRGRLYELPSGIPVLEVPEADVLAHGTADPLADLSVCDVQAGVATQARLAAEFAAHPDPGETNPQDSGFGRAEGAPAGREPWMASVNGAPGDRWGPVYGELLTFDDPEPAFRPSTTSRASCPADLAFTGVCWCRPSSMEVLFQRSSMRAGATGQPCATLAGFKVAIDGHIQKKTVTGEKRV